MKAERLVMVFWLMAMPASARGAELRVHVVDSRAGDVDGAEVRVVSVQGSRTAKTDAAGMVLLADLAEGRYDVRVRARGFYTKEVQNCAVSAAEKRPLLVNVQMAVMNCGEPPDIEYEKRGRGGVAVRGRVSNYDTNKGMRGARLTLRRTDGPREKIVVRSQKNGEFVAAEMGPGRYRVAVTNDFFLEEDFYVLVAAGETAVVKVSLDGNDHIHVCE